MSHQTAFDGLTICRRNRNHVACLILLLFLYNLASAEIFEINADICVYGGNSGGIIAAVQAARMGKKVALIVQNNHLGGMTSGGLGWTDIGHADGDTGSYIQGVAREFYNRVGQNYGVSTSWSFEPHVAETVFNQMIQAAGVTTYTNESLFSVVKQGQQIVALTMDSGNLYRAKVFIDATYEGDLMAKAGVSYEVGRESAAQYGESAGGVAAPSATFGSYTVNPYVIPGDPASGLLPLIQSGGYNAIGSADQLLQAYNFRMCLTKVLTNMLPILAPTNYDAKQYELLGRYIESMVNGGATLSLGSLLTISTMPNGKTDINNNGAISTDFVGHSAPWVEANRVSRVQIWQDHKNYLQGLLYFLATDSRVPSAVQAQMKSYGLCKDEFTDNGGWPWPLYVREARRMVSDYVMTQSNVMNQLKVPDSIGLAGYFTDCHNCSRICTNGVVMTLGGIRQNITVSYPVSYRALVPRSNECTNLLVPWSLSASHVAFCSLRMEPVFMILGQAAGTAACLAIDDGVGVQNVNLPRLQAQLMKDKQAIGTATATTSSNNVIIDNPDASGIEIVGSWISSAASAGFYGTDYLHDNNINKGSCSVTFRPTLPQSGSYQVYARWTTNANRSKNVPIDIGYYNGTNTVQVDQMAQGGQWVLLITTNFSSGTNGFVRIRNAGTSGYVIADAVQFVSANTLFTNYPNINIWAEDGVASRLGSKSGSIAIAYSGATNQPVTVFLKYSGTASNGLDYQMLNNALTLPAGVNSTNLIIVPFTNSLAVGDKVALVSLITNAQYLVGNMNSATVTVEDTPINIWRLKWFGSNANNSQIAGDAANYSGDGVPNLAKYALGFNPNQICLDPGFIKSNLDSNKFLVVSYTRPDPPPPDIAYRIESSRNLVTWTSNAPPSVVGIVFNSSNTAATVTFRDSLPVNDDSMGFRRIFINRVVPH